MGADHANYSALLASVRELPDSSDKHDLLVWVDGRANAQATQAAQCEEYLEQGLVFQNELQCFSIERDDVLLCELTEIRGIHLGLPTSLLPNLLSLLPGRGGSRGLAFARLVLLLSILLRPQLRLSALELIVEIAVVRGSGCSPLDDLLEVSLE